MSLGRRLKSPVVLFTASRYFSYFLLFVRGVLVAKYLSPAGFGLYAFFSLVQQYMIYAGLGVHYATNVKLSTEGESLGEDKSGYTSNALIFSVAMAMALIAAGAFLQWGPYEVLPKYSFRSMAFLAGLVAGLNLLQQLLVNVYRVYGKLFRIAAVEVGSAVLVLATVLAFRHHNLLIMVLSALAASSGMAVLVYLVKPPFQPQWKLEWGAVRELVRVGVPLVIYNLSFSGIALAGQTAVSVFYTVREMGTYSLANSIALVAMLGLNSVTWVAFPSMLSKMREPLDAELVARRIARTNALFGTAVTIVVFLSLLCLPMLYWILPDYRGAGSTLQTLLLAQGVIALSFASNCVAIARNRQNDTAAISMVAALVVLATSVTAGLLGLRFLWVGIAVLAGAFVYTHLQGQVGRSLLRDSEPARRHLGSALRPAIVLSVFIAVGGNLLGEESLGAAAGLLVFLASSRKPLVELWDFVVHPQPIALPGAAVTVGTSGGEVL